MPSPASRQARLVFVLLVIGFVAAVNAASCPWGCSCVQTSGVVTFLSCNSSVSEIPIDLPISTVTLDIHATSITTLGDNAFQAAVSLKAIILPEAITSIAPAAFAGLSALTSVTFEQSAMFDQSLFTGLEVEHIGIGNASTLQGNSFTSMSFLKRLGLYEVSTLPSGALAGLASLATLELYGPFTSIPSSVLNDAPNVDLLTLHGQFQTMSDIGLASLPNLKKLSISQSKLTGFTDLSANALTYLSVSGSSTIKTLADNSFAGVPNLKFLSVDGLGLENLSSQAFSGLSQLTYLSLSQTRVKSLPQGLFAGTPALKALSLSPIKITQLSSNTFSTLTALTSLTLTGMPATTLPPGLFLGLTALTQLSTSPHNFSFGNNLQAPPSTFGLLSSLQACHSACATCYGAGAGSCCPTNCLRCAGDGTCSQCYEGFALEEQLCVAIPPAVLASSASSALEAVSIAAQSAESVVSAASAASVLELAAAAASSISAASALDASVSAVAVAASRESVLSVQSVQSAASARASQSVAAATNNNDDDGPAVMPIVVSVLAGVLFLVLVALGVVLLRRRNPASRSKDSFDSHTVDIHPNPAFGGTASNKGVMDSRLYEEVGGHPSLAPPAVPHLYNHPQDSPASMTTETHAAQSPQYEEVAVLLGSRPDSGKTYAELTLATGSMAAPVADESVSYATVVPHFASE
ncbi:hypothetical protein, variant [Capsaspora owczarzaki ATCC 30864]|nr:hypothetical protein, variant [Capsaspora owczarzaki ATCC 30864]|eukprot:XP_011270422.1 hypothetical protein, variant [Capsaspora owczarzaki ATCC 30864]